MNFDKVLIKQIPDEYATYTGLHKYGRSKMPKTTEALQPAIFNGRAITGLDEEALVLNSIKDPKEREAKQAEIKALRLSLQEKLGADLSATSTYWETFIVYIGSDSDLLLDMSNPMHVVMYRVLVANGYAAPDKERASYPDYRLAKYYCYIEEKAQDEEASNRFAKDKIKTKLVAMYDEPEKMALIGQYLEGDKYKKGMSNKTLYNMLSNFIENTKESNNLKAFSKAVELPVEDLQYKITIDRALRKKIIKVKSGQFQIGSVILGKTPNEIYENLKKPEFFSEFIAIQDQLEETA